MTAPLTIKIRLDVEQDSPSRSDMLTDAQRQEIIKRLESGDVWAWCGVIVTATLTLDKQVFIGKSSLWGCSYENEADFKQKGGYYEDLKKDAIEAMWDHVQQAIDRGNVGVQAMLSNQLHQTKIEEE